MRGESSNSSLLLQSHKKGHNSGKLYASWVLFFGHFLRDPRKPRQLKPQAEPLQLKAFSTIKRALGWGSVPPYGAIGSPYRRIRSLYGPLLTVKLSVSDLAPLIVRVSGCL